MTKPFEFLVFSDLHAHSHPYGATRTIIPGMSGLYNSRLADCAFVLDEIFEYAKQREIKTVVFCGDLFHRRSSVSTDVRHVIVDRLHRFADEDIQLHMIPGNHDMGDRKGNYHSLIGLGELSDYIHVYDQVGYHTCEGANFVFAPYTDSLSTTKWMLEAAGKLSEMSSLPSILFGHLGMQGAKVGSDFVLVADSDISVSDVPNDRFAACFFGHFHEHQQLFANGWYVGATHQHNWGDSNGQRGFLHAKVDKGKVSFERIKTAAPEFIMTRLEEPSCIKENDFVKLLTTDKFLEREKLKERWGLKHLEIVVETEDEETEFSLDTTQLSPLAVLDQWVASKLPEDLDKDKVLNIGKDILKEVGYE